jgi:hypothetical protein
MSRRTKGVKAISVCKCGHDLACHAKRTRWCSYKRPDAGFWESGCECATFVRAPPSRIAGERETMKLLIVEWEDSSSFDGWNSLEYLREQNGMALLCRSVGWLVGRNSKTITLAGSLSGEKNPGCRVKGSGDISIPVKCVTRITEIRKPARRAARGRGGR